LDLVLDLVLVLVIDLVIDLAFAFDVVLVSSPKTTWLPSRCC